MERRTASTASRIAQRDDRPAGLLVFDVERAAQLMRERCHQLVAHGFELTARVEAGPVVGYPQLSLTIFNAKRQRHIALATVRKRVPIGIGNGFHREQAQRNGMIDSYGMGLDFAVEINVGLLPVERPQLCG